MNPIAVIDFETTGLSPAMGDRATASRIQGDIQREYEVEDAPHELLMKLQRCQRKALPKAIKAYFA